MDISQKIYPQHNSSNARVAIHPNSPDLDREHVQGVQLQFQIVRPLLQLLDGRRGQTMRAGSLSRPVATSSRLYGIMTCVMAL